MKELGGWIPAGAAAEQLGVSRTQIHRLVESGHLEGEQPGRELFVSATSVQHRAQVVRPRAGRPLSPRMAWAVLTFASGRSPSWISPSEKVRVRKYAKAPLAQWPSGLARRAEIHRVRMLPHVLKKLRSTPEVARGGVDAAADHGSLLVGSEVSEFYISAAVLANLKDTKGIRWNSPETEANVIVRVVPPTLSAATIAEILGQPLAPLAAAAADLLDRGDDRSVSAATALLKSVRLP